MTRDGIHNSDAALNREGCIPGLGLELLFTASSCGMRAGPYLQFIMIDYVKVSQRG